MVKGYDLFGSHGRDLPTPHGSGARPMYGDMGKSRPCDPNKSYPLTIKDIPSLDDVLVLLYPT